VHVNRVLKEFRQRSLISMGRRMMSLLNGEELQAPTGFNKDYLHLGGAHVEVTRYFDSLEKAQRGDTDPALSYCPAQKLTWLR